MRKVLLVDDGKSSRYVLRMLLQKHNCEVNTANDAKVALHMVNENPPDAIFMDIFMPGMGGIEALGLLKANPKTAHIPVVICTAHDEPEYLAKAHEAGAIGLIYKPCMDNDVSVMLAAIDEAITTQTSLKL